MGMEYKDMQKLLDTFKITQKNHEAFIRKFLLEMGMRTLAQTKALTPVDTGNLRNHWELSQVMRRGDELWIVIFNSALYASHVEDGHMQHRRFLPLKYLEQSVKSRRIARYARKQYGKDVKGIMLKEKWVPGKHMARISITKVQQEIPVRYKKALKQFMSGLGDVT